MFMKHVLAIVCCSLAAAPSQAGDSCQIAGWEVPASACSSHNRTLAATCFNCHGPNGHSTAAIPGLAGQSKAYIVEAMKDFRDGKREATVMKKYAMGFTDDEYETLAALFSAVQVNLAQNKEQSK